MIVPRSVIQDYINFIVLYYLLEYKIFIEFVITGIVHPKMVPT